MLAVTPSLMATSRSLFNESRKHRQLAAVLNTMYSCTCRIGTGTIMYDIEHPKYGSVTVYQHISPDEYQPPFTLETRGDNPWLYEFGTIEEVVRKLK